MQTFIRLSACVALLASCVLSAPVVRRDLLISGLPVTHVDTGAVSSKSGTLLSASTSDSAATVTLSRRMAMPIANQRESAQALIGDLRNLVNKCDVREIIGQCNRERLQSVYKEFEGVTVGLAWTYKLDCDAAAKAMHDIYGGEGLSDVYEVERALGAFERDISHAGRARMEESLEKMGGLVLKLASDVAYLEDMKDEQSSFSFSSATPMATAVAVEQVAPTSTSSATSSTIASSASSTTTPPGAQTLASVTPARG